jgi:hypothetical protein
MKKALKLFYFLIQNMSLNLPLNSFLSKFAYGGTHFVLTRRDYTKIGYEFPSTFSQSRIFFKFMNSSQYGI